MEKTVKMMPNMLSIREAARMGPLSEYALRLLHKQGQLPGVQVGVKFLVNYDVFLESLNRDTFKAD